MYVCVCVCVCIYIYFFPTLAFSLILEETGPFVVREFPYGIKTVPPSVSSEEADQILVCFFVLSFYLQVCQQCLVGSLYDEMDL